MSKLCSRCGKENDSTSKFCIGCGAKLVVPNTSPVTPPPPTTPQNPQNISSSKQSTSFFNSKTLLIILITVISTSGLLAGGYYFYQHQQELAVEAALQKAEGERAAAEKLKQEKAEKEASDKVKKGITTALNHLSHNESMLKDLSDKINSGNYDRTYFNMQRNSFFTELLSPLDSIDIDMESNETVTKDEVKAMIELQRLRANMMYSGLNGDTSKFATGGLYYDDYYNKLAAFKNKYNVQ